MPRSKDKTLNAVVVKNNRTKGHPLVAVVEGKTRQIEDLLSRAPEKTLWAEQMLQGASRELEKLEPVSDTQIKQIFPRASPTVMQDPLKVVDKTRIHDNIRRDNTTPLALFIFCYFMLGKENTISMGLNRKYANEKRKQEAMAEIQNNEEYLDILEDIMNRDDDIDLQTRKLELIFSGSAFGRSVGVMQYDKSGLPARIIPLSSTRLGRVWVDKKTWEFLGVEYNDYTRDKRILLAKDIIHYECNDVGITPKSRYYGMAMLESLMAVGERNRVANEIAKPEIHRRMWAPIMLVKTNTKSQKLLNSVRDAFASPGKTVIYNDHIEVQVVSLQHDLEKLNNSTKEGEKDIFRGCTVPLGIGFQDEQNRATLEGTLLQWYEGTLNYKRAHLDSVMWHQYYKPQLQKIFLERHIIGMPFRIVTEYTNISTSGFLDKGSTMLGYFNAGLVNGPIARTEAGLEKWNDDMAEWEQNKKTLSNNMVTQEMDMEADQQGITGIEDISKKPLTTNR